MTRIARYTTKGVKDEGQGLGSNLALAGGGSARLAGAQGADPQNDPRENWRDDPTAAEMAEMDREERCAA
jgi:hypothetical protein